MYRDWESILIWLFNTYLKQLFPVYLGLWIVIQMLDIMIISTLYVSKD